MYCTQCGTQIPDSEKKCPSCGEDITIAPVAYPLIQNISELQMTNIPPKASKKRKTVWIAAACVFVLACAIFIPMLVKSIRYEEAIAFMDAGEAERARETFVSMAGYKEADELAQECQDQIDFNAAKAQMDNGEYGAAKKAFQKLGDFGEAAAMAEECQNSLDYESAVKLMENNSNWRARDVFLKLGSYKDSSELAAECQRRVDYTAAEAWMENGDYEQAQKAFAALGDYSDAKELAGQCQKGLNYIAADTAYNQGNFYTAYVLFRELGSYEDSISRARSCIQTYPDSGELYRNEDYASKRCSLTITTADDGFPTFIKIYTEDDVLVSALFIASGGKVKVKLPVGSYRMKSATGMDWFGVQEMFGDDGTYEVLDFGNDTNTWYLKSSYIYTLELRSETDGNVGAQNVDPSNF